VTFLLDTNVVSELRKIGSGRAHPGVAEWARSVDAALFYLSIITVMEIELGLLRLERKDRGQAAHLRIWFTNQVLDEFADRIIPVDQVVASKAASLHVPDPRPERDAYIAATALVHGMTVITRNVADFAPMNVRLLNPWEDETNAGVSRRRRGTSSRSLVLLSLQPTIMDDASQSGRRHAASPASLAGSPAMRLCHMMRGWVMSQGVAWCSRQRLSHTTTSPACQSW
jgi:toxin FitB